MADKVKALDAPTWEAFAELVEHDNGLFGMHAWILTLTIEVAA